MSDGTATKELEGVPTTTQVIPLSLIRENKTALRGVDRKGEKYLELLSSVKRDGVMMNITVRACIDDVTKAIYYGLIDGLQRFTAAKDAGLSQLECKVVEASDYEVLRRQVVLNVQRVETKPVEYSQALARMLQHNPMMTIKDLADEIGKTPVFIYERLGLLKLDEKIAKLVDAGQMPLQNAYAVAKLPTEEQGNFIDRGTTQQPAQFVPQVMSRLKEIRDANRQGKDAKPETFTPAARLRKLADLKAEFDSPSIADTLLKGIKDPKEAFKMALAFALNLDPISTAKAEADFKQHKADMAAAKDRKTAEAAKKAEADKLNSALGVK